ncbi:hypothetical protein BC962_1121 [Gillisia mitskevichiae]|uniref:Uncharacterized protein n=1 Tax=Gillisia mitskevichiae TaxID=270921 RepID=A0A495Q009_9FLAO|nr:hypothetical protein [Gillisia mitskevichiae]RKS56142.1 hypothetical protein BC962_1121 [Gillisia mitskevichiae]
MNFKKVITAEGFWKSVAGMGLSFIVVYHIITMLFTFGGFDFSGYFELNLSEERWMRFVLGSLFSGFLYGFIITFGQFSIKQKKEEREH